MRKFNVTVDGVTYEVEVEEIGGAVVQTPVTVAPVATPVAPAQKASAPAPKTAPKAVAGGAPIKAPMPGSIVKLLVADGASVTKGQAILVLEAMKMENDIVADRDGTVNFAVKAGDSVETGATIATIA